jgi:hypothetical protein
VDEVEQVEMADWVSSWLAVGSMGDPVAGYARLAEGPLGQVIASFTLLAEGFGSSGYCPCQRALSALRPGPKLGGLPRLRQEFIPTWSLEGAAKGR